MGFKTAVSIESSYDELIISASAAEIREKHYPSVPLEDMPVILSADPTVNKGNPVTLEDLSRISFGKFTKTLMKAFVAGEAFITNGSLYCLDCENNRILVRQLIEEFSKVSKNLPQNKRDFNAYPSLKEVSLYLAKEAYEAVRATMKEKAESEAEVKYEDETWVIIVPESHFASVYFADYEPGRPRKGSWCTAWDSTLHYNQYKRNGELYMCMNKKDKNNSYQIYLPGDHPEDRDYAKASSATYTDEVSTGENILSNIPPELIPAFKSFGIDLTSHDVLYSSYEEEEDEEEHEPQRTYEKSIYAGSSTRVDGSFSVSVYGSLDSYEAEWDYDRDDYDDYGDPETLSSSGILLTISPFDYRKFDASLLDFDEVNFAAPGILINLEDGKGLDQIDDSLREEYPQEYREASRGNDDLSELETAISKVRIAASHLSGKNSSRSDTAFAVFLNTAGMETSDDLVGMVKRELQYYSTFYDENSAKVDSNESLVVSEGYLTYEGDYLPVIIISAPRAGGLAQALTDKKFAIHVGDPDTLAGLSHYPEQEQKDRQLKLDETWASLKTSMTAKHKEYVAQRLKVLNKKNVYLA